MGVDSTVSRHEIVIVKTIVKPMDRLQHLLLLVFSVTSPVLLQDRQKADLVLGLEYCGLEGSSTAKTVRISSMLCAVVFCCVLLCAVV